MRKVKNRDIPTFIDGYDKPSERFAEVYGELYSSVDDKEDTKKIFNVINGSIGEDSIEDVNLVTPKLIEDVIEKIKPNKNEVAT